MIGIVGAGRLGRSLEALLSGAGVPTRLKSRDEPWFVADTWLVCVPDRAVATLGDTLPAQAIALHTSGALPADALGPRVRGGVLHPLMTFPGPERALPTLRGVAARVGGHPDAVAAARGLCATLEMAAFAVEDAEATRYHAAAALASGHLAALFLEAANVLAGAARMDPVAARAALLPLAQQALDRAAALGPAAITGPVVRGDHGTVAGHLAELPPALRPVYEALADAILRSAPEYLAESRVGGSASGGTPDPRR